jgi:hypothetical protein
MAKLISAPTVVPAAGRPAKIIEEFFGRVNSQTSVISIAKMTSPAGWSEPGQTPEFDSIPSYCAVRCKFETGQGIHKVTVGQAILIKSGEWVRYCTPGPEGAEYIAVCLPAFSPQTVHHDE